MISAAEAVVAPVLPLLPDWVVSVLQEVELPRHRQSFDRVDDRTSHMIRILLYGHRDYWPHQDSGLHQNAVGLRICTRCSSCSFLPLSGIYTILDPSTSQSALALCR